VLYRLAEPAEGRIIIDGVDTTKIGVYDLRSKLSIIPQEPQLFVGAVRYNIDPFNATSDEEIWEALRIAGLKDFVSSLAGKLEEAVSEGGSNFSVGQRQLFCLARALLRKSRVLVLDEATASVDFDTDILIQRALRSAFPNTTLMVIAHRLNTVMDMNRIIALDKGTLVEFLSPAELLKNKESMLYGMVQATGNANAKQLVEIALGKVDVFSSFEKMRKKSAGEDILPKSSGEKRSESGSVVDSKSESPHKLKSDDAKVKVKDGDKPKDEKKAKDEKKEKKARRDASEPKSSGDKSASKGKK